MSILDRSFALGAANFQIEVLKAEIEKLKAENCKLVNFKLKEASEIVCPRINELEKALSTANEWKTTYHEAYLRHDAEVEKLKAENERLKRENLRYRDDFEIVAKENNQLKAELMEERLKNVNYHCQLKELRRPKEQCKFKVGDRVCFTYYIDFREAKRKGTVLEIEDDELTIDHDGYISHLHFSRCKKLVRKPKFKVGDIVKVYFDNFNNPVYLVKGKVINISEEGFLKVDHSLGISRYHTRYCKRLVKKPKFKPGDRVSFFVNNERIKSTVIDVDAFESVVKVKPDNPNYLNFYPRISECKRLVKVKKVNCVRCFLNVIFGIFPTPNCKDCNGTGVVKEKCSQ